MVGRAQEVAVEVVEVPLTPSLQQLVAQGFLTLQQARDMMPKEESASAPPEDPVDAALQVFYDRWLSALVCDVKNAQTALVIAENIIGLCARKANTYQ